MSKENRVIFYISIFLFAIMAFSFTLLAFEKDGGNHTFLISNISGVMFWVGLIIGCTMQIILIKKYRKAISRNKRHKSEKIGLISFFKNKIAIIFDILFIISIIGFIVEIVFTDMTPYICYITLSLLIFSFIMHCILNGKIFRYIFKK